MRRLLDAPIRLSLRAAYPIVLGYWRRRHAFGTGAVVGIAQGDHVLVVRNSYRPGWGLAGGGIDAHETPIEAARREIREELGLEIEEERIKPLATVSRLSRDWPVHDQLFEVELTDRPAAKVDGREIVEARWMSIEQLAGERLQANLVWYLRHRKSKISDVG